MTAPLVLLLAVTANPGGISMARDAAAACLESMPAGAKSMVRLAPAVPQDAAVAGEASTIGAAAVVILTWHEATLLTTDLRIFVAEPEDGVTHWITRTIVFSVRDLPGERGRALGLVIASVLDESWGIAPTAKEEPAAPIVPAPEQPNPKIEERLVEVATRAGPPESPEPPQRWALEANVTTAAGHWGDVDDCIGGMIGLRRSLSRHWALRAGLGFQVADIDGADATARTVLGAVGVVWMSAGFEQPRQFAFGGRADLLGMHAVIQRGQGRPDSSQTQGYGSFGADLLAQVGYGLSRATALLVAGGVEEFLTEADVYAAGVPVATLPHTQLVLELGVLSRF